MVFKYNLTRLPFAKKLVLSLSNIYGVGYEKASYIANTLGYNNVYNIEYLNTYYFDCILRILKSNYVLDVYLNQLVNQRLLLFTSLKTTKGRRLIKGLPVRGGRTHSNGKTPKKFKLNV